MSVSMNIIRDTQTTSVMQDGMVCPNCWGHSQWENRDCREEFKIDKGSKTEVFSRNGFIRRFVKMWLKPTV